MKIKPLFLSTVLLVVGLAGATAQSSQNAVAVVGDISGVHCTSYTYSENQDYLFGTANEHDDSFVTWHNGAGGSSFTDNLIYFSSDPYVWWLDCDWPASFWPNPLPNATATEYRGDHYVMTNQVYPWRVGGGTGGVHIDTSATSPSTGSSFTWKFLTGTTLTTGGGAGSTSKSLFEISVSATAENNPEPPNPDHVPWYPDSTFMGVSSEQISVGVFGKLDSMGHAYAVLPDNKDVDITPNVAGQDSYTFNVGVTKCNLEAPSVAPDQGILVTTNPVNTYLVSYCEGSSVTVVGTPCCSTDPRALALYWHMDGPHPANSDGTEDLTKCLVDRGQIGTQTITAAAGGLSTSIKVIVYQAKFEIDADAGNCLPNVGHAWWNLSIAPSDAVAFIPSNLQYAQGIAGYYDHCQPQGVGQVIFGTQTDRCGGGEVHTTTGSYWWCISFGSYINALGKVDQLNQWPGMYDIFGNNCVAQAMAIGVASGVSVGYNGIQPCGLSECLNQLIMSLNPGPPQCNCTQ